jgi:hypothetical protein
LRSLSRLVTSMFWRTLYLDEFQHIRLDQNHAVRLTTVWRASFEAR